MTDLRSLTDEERAAMEVACNIEDHLAHQPEPRGACFRRGFLAALAYVREQQEPSDDEVERAAKALWDEQVWAQGLIAMSEYRQRARAALKAARER
jgi:hypothetical protein